MAEYYFPIKQFLTEAGVTQEDIEFINSKYVDTRAGVQGLPVFAILRAVNKERKTLVKAAGMKSQDSEDSETDFAYKYERTVSLKIQNQLKLSILITKEEASIRVRRAIAALINKIRYLTRSVAPKLLYKKDLTDVESILIDSWKDAIVLLKEEVTVLPWELSGSKELMQTRLMDLSDFDEEFQDEIRSRINKALTK